MTAAGSNGWTHLAPPEGLVGAVCLGASGRASDGLTMWLVLAAAAAVVVGLLARARSGGQVRGARDGAELFGMTLDAVGLTREERRDLRFVARRLTSLREPTAMLLSPHSFAMAVRDALARSDDPGRRRRLDELGVKLFGVGIPEIDPRTGVS